MTEGELEEAIEQGVLRAFRTLGIDAHNPHETQRDFAFLRDMRTGTQSLKSKTMWAILSGVVLAICGFVWVGFNAAIHAVQSGVHTP